MRKKLLLLLALPILVIVLLVAWVKQPSWVRADSAESVVLVDPRALERHVRVLSEEFVPRDFSHPENLDRAADYIRHHFEQVDLVEGRVSEQAYEVESRTYRNVLLELGPEEGKAIVLGAHYDAYDVYPGADDNASGVAGLLVLAQLLGYEELKQPVHLVAYTLEEPPIFRTAKMGSAVHAASLAERRAEVDFMVSIEMIGFFSDEPKSQSYPLGSLGLIYPTTANFIAVVGDFSDGGLVRRIKRAMVSASDLPVRSINAPANLVEGIDFSDHLNYWKEGFPAVMVTDTSFFRYSEYHTAEDTAEKLDYERMAKVVGGLYQVVVEGQK